MKLLIVSGALLMVCVVNVDSSTNDTSVGRHGQVCELSECASRFLRAKFSSIETDLEVLSHRILTQTGKIQAQGQQIQAQGQQILTQGQQIQAQGQQIQAQGQQIQAQGQQIESQKKQIEIIQKQLPPKPCPFGFEFMPESYQCLKLVRQRLSWNGAREACGRLGPGVKMVAITNHAKQAAVTRYLQNEFIKPQSSTCVLPEWLPGGKMVWISGQTRDPNRCGNYVWKPAPGEEIGFTYTNWNRGEPNCGGEHCIIVGSGIGYRWNDGHCHTLTCSVCEI